jgi:hypothetical protein
MYKKFIITTIMVIALITILITGCGKGSPGPGAKAGVSPSTTPSAAQSAASPSPSSGTQDTTPANPSVMQDGLPLTLTEPAEAAELNTGTVTVKGQTVPGAAVNVNDNATVADSSGNFSATINLDPGPNAIDVIATDDSGQEGEVLILVNVVSSASPAANPPDLAGISPNTIPLQVTQPADSATLSTNTVDVKGQTAPGAMVIVNDQIDTADASGNFSITVFLDPGPNVIDVAAQDDDGNNNEVMVMVNVVS